MTKTINAGGRIRCPHHTGVDRTGKENLNSPVCDSKIFKVYYNQTTDVCTVVCNHDHVLTTYVLGVCEVRGDKIEPVNREHYERSLNNNNADTPDSRGDVIDCSPRPDAEYKPYELERGKVCDGSDGQATPTTEKH